MLSAGSPRSRSPSESTVATSVRTGPTTNVTSQVSHQSSIVEDDESGSYEKKNFDLIEIFHGKRSF